MPFPSISITNAIDIPAWLEQDRQNSWETRVEREQSIINKTDLDLETDKQRVLYWWSKVQPQEETNSSGHQLDSIFKRVSVIAILLGLVAGLVLAGSLLHYDGTQPINVLVLLIVLVLIPLLLFLLSLLVPIFRSNSLISSLNIGNQVLTFLKRKV